MCNENTSTLTEDGTIAALNRPRVGIVCDLLEERWPSMDLVGDMLLENLQRNQASSLIAERLRPAQTKHSLRVGQGPEHTAGLTERAFNRFVKYPLWLSRQKQEFDLFHVVDHSYAHLVHHLPADRTIVTCHDVDAFRCLLEPARTVRRRVWRRVTLRIVSGLQKAAWVICDSGATADELLAQGWAHPEQMSVIRLGVDSVFSPQADATADREA